MEMPKFLRQMGFYLFARRFVAGETIDDAIKKAHELRKKGVYATINILGEHIKDPKKAEEYFYQYLILLGRLKDEGLLDCYISIKPSQLGLDIKEDIFEAYMVGLLAAARVFLPGAFVEVDRESRSYAKSVRQICLKLVKSGYVNIRIARQMNFNDTPEEIEESIKAGSSDRLCKGTAYSGDIKDKNEIQKRYLEKALLLSKKGNCPAIATHDLSLIDQLANEDNLEFQVLLGIENKKMMKFAQKGKKVRFYLPCGPNWYPYGKRRGKSIPRIMLRNWLYRRKKPLKAIF